MMNKLIFLIITVLGFVQVSFAQTHDSTEVASVYIYNEEYVKYIFFFILGILVGYGMTFLTSKNKKGGFPEVNLKEEFTTLEQELTLRIDEKIKLMGKNKMPSEKIASSGDKLEWQIPAYSSASEPQNRNQPPTEVLSIYFKIPESDGSFKISDADDTKNNYHYFNIKYNERENKGNLFYLSSVYDMEAINDLDSYLKPVCKIENPTKRPVAKRIQQNKPGKVTKSGNSWVIDPNNKLEVKLY